MPLGKYTLSRSGDFYNISCVVYLKDDSGKNLVAFGVNEHKNAEKVIINTDNYPNYSYMTCEIKRNNNNVEMRGTVYFQLEVGETATAYRLYKEPTTYTSTADGTVEGITSIAPSMTLLTDAEGVAINANYYKDPDIVISNLQQAVAMSGGE